MKKYAFLLFVVLSLSLPVAALAAEETPVPWYTDAQAYVTGRGIMTGTDRGFEPETAITYATVYQVFYNMSGQPQIDCPVEAAAGQWYEAAASWAVGMEMASGDTPFDKVIDRGGMALPLMKYYLRQGGEGRSELMIDSASELYPMCEQRSEEAFALAFCQEVGLLKGDEAGSLRPYASLTRAEFAQILMNLERLLCEQGASGFGGGQMGETEAAGYVEGLIRAVYLGQFDESYLQMAGIAAEEAQKGYEENLRSAAEAFAFLFHIQEPDDNFLAQLEKVWGKAYQQIRYEVGPAFGQKDGSCYVAVNVEPADTLRQVGSEWSWIVMVAQIRHYDLVKDNEDFDFLKGMEARDEEIAELLLKVFEEKLSQVSYGSDRCVFIQVERDELGMTHANPYDLGRLDALMFQDAFEEENGAEESENGSEGPALNHSGFTLFTPGETFQLEFLQDIQGEIIWTTSDPGVAEVDREGAVTAVGPGACEITATLDTGLARSCEVRCYWK